MDKIINLPRHRPPVLHKNAVNISFENCFKLGKTYNEIIGQKNIHHFSLNVVDAKGEMTILSYNPQIAYNIFKDGSYLYNGSISPTYYENKDIYTWDETYDPQRYHLLKNNMERKNGISTGVVLTKRINGLILLYSFATKGNGTDFLLAIKDQKKFFLQAGDHCFEQIKPIIEDRIINHYCMPIKKEKNIRSNVFNIRNDV